jgi:hypothetical protein
MQFVYRILTHLTIFKSVQTMAIILRRICLRMMFNVFVSIVFLITCINFIMYMLKGDSESTWFDPWNTHMLFSRLVSLATIDESMHKRLTDDLTNIIFEC